MSLETKNKHSKNRERLRLLKLQKREDTITALKNNIKQYLTESEIIKLCLSDPDDTLIINFINRDIIFTTNIYNPWTEIKKVSPL